MRRSGWVRTAAAATLVTVIGGIGAVTAAPASAAPAITVTPPTGALEGQPLEVSVTGLADGTDARAVLCGGTAASTCSTNLDVEDGFVTPLPPAAGTRAGMIMARRSLVVGPTTYDCTVGCHVVLLDGAGTALASTPVSVAASGTYVWPQAQLSVTVVDPRANQRRWRLEATGLSPWVDFGQISARASVDVCRDVPSPGPADCAYGKDPINPLYPFSSHLEEVTPLGTLDEAAALNNRAGPPMGPLVDCRKVACTVSLSQDGGAATNRVPISFPDEWAPWPTADRFLTEGVEVVRGAPLTPQQWAELVTALTDRTRTGRDVLADAAAEVPATASPAEVSRIYSAFFRRPPETGGLGYWIGRMEDGLTVSGMGRLFGGTAEFRAIYDPLTDRQVVERTYERIFSRVPAEGEIAYWVGRLEGGMARSTLIVHFSRSAEFKARSLQRDRATVLMWTLLGRGLSPDDLGWSATTIAGRILSSPDLYERIDD